MLYDRYLERRLVTTCPMRLSDLAVASSNSVTFEVSKMNAILFREASCSFHARTKSWESD